MAAGRNPCRHSFYEGKRTEREIRYAFHAFCKKALRYEAINAYRDIAAHRKKYISFSDLPPREKRQLFTYDRHFEQGYHIAGIEVTGKQLAAALDSLTEHRKAIIRLYYFEHLTDREISLRLHAPRSTIQYRRTRALLQLRDYLEKHVHDGE